MPGKQKKPRVTRREKKAQVANLVEAANKSKDLMNKFSEFSVYHYDDAELKIEYQTPFTILREDMHQIFDLLETNMKHLYEKSDWGWDELQKKHELSDENAKFLVVKNNDGKVLGFTHFRFEVDFNYPVMYCYELQITEEVQRKGIGKYLMNLLLLIAFKFKLAKVMLTVFTFNDPALDFYQKCLGFRRDETCPYEEEEKCYVILAKVLDQDLVDDIKRKMHAERRKKNN